MPPCSASLGTGKRQPAVVTSSASFPRERTHGGLCSSRSWRTLWVDGPTDHQLSDFLGGSAANCKLVREKSIFYLPFNANLS